MPENKSNRDILIGLSNDMAWVKQILNDHIAHHRKLLYIGIGLITTITGGVLLNALLT